MIISDHHKLAFIHIPKCAGTSLRQLLVPFDDQTNAFEGIHENHRWGGRIDLMHIPLAQLSRHFPNAYAKVAAYRSFAVVRDPGERFVSSLAEHLRYRTGKDLTQLPYELVRRTARKLSARLLEGAEPWRDPRLVHFQPQVDYVRHDGRQIVETLVPLEDVSRIPAMLDARYGVATGASALAHANRTLAGSETRKRFGTVPFRVRVLMRLRGLGLGAPAGDAVAERLADEAAVADLVTEYYKEDGMLHASARDAFAASLPHATPLRTPPALEKDAQA
tara:strand:+ start:8634 stop:9464 length:831 start_codon:yes stop_codon:yes gene_type:complete